jgi:predicted esterase
MSTARTIAAQVHGTYFVQPPEAGSADPATNWLVGFHGYGENAERHLRELRRVPGISRWGLCAVQALHPFYNSKTGEVVASWMTKLDREAAIADNLAYVHDIVARLREESPGGRLVYAGFSQGVAMAWRAGVRGGHPCQGVIALAGDVPPELAEQEIWGVPRALLVRGTGDTWYDAGKEAQDLALLRQKNVEVTSCVFAGGHEWTAEAHQAAGEFLASC